MLYTDRLPFSIRVLLESAVRNCDDFQVTKRDVEKILDWENNQIFKDGVEVAFKPARVILQVKSKILRFLSAAYKRYTYCCIINRILLEYQQSWILLQ